MKRNVVKKSVKTPPKPSKKSPSKKAVKATPKKAEKIKVEKRPKIRNIASLCYIEQMPEIHYSGKDILENNVLTIDEIVNPDLTGSGFASNACNHGVYNLNYRTLVTIKTGVFIDSITEGYCVKFYLSNKLSDKGIIYLDTGKEITDGEICVNIISCGRSIISLPKNLPIGRITLEKVNLFKAIKRETT